MKIFKNWEDDVSAFVIFLAKDAVSQNRRMRKLHKEYYHNGDVNAIKQYNLQCGVAMQINTIYNIAKYHFNLDSFNRKHTKKHENDC